MKDKTKWYAEGIDDKNHLCFTWAATRQEVVEKIPVKYRAKALIKLNNPKTIEAFEER